MSNFNSTKNGFVLITSSIAILILLTTAMVYLSITTQEYSLLNKVTQKKQLLLEHFDSQFKAIDFIMNTSQWTELLSFSDPSSEIHTNQIIFNDNNHLTMQTITQKNEFNIDSTIDVFQNPLFASQFMVLSSSTWEGYRLGPIVVGNLNSQSVQIQSIVFSGNESNNAFLSTIEWSFLDAPITGTVYSGVEASLPNNVVIPGQTQVQLYLTFSGLINGPISVLFALDDGSIKQFYGNI